MRINKLAEIIPQSVSHDASILKKVIAKRGDIPHITQVAQVVLKPGDVVAEHEHKDLFEVFYVESGEVSLMVNGTESTLTAGEIVTIELNDKHSFKNKSPKDAIMLYFGVEV